VQPLRSMGANVVQLFHTYSTCNTTRDERLVETMDAVDHVFVPSGSTAHIVDSYIAVIDLLHAWTAESGRHADFVHLMRFDLYLRRSPLDMGILWNSLNLPWRAEQEYWHAQRTTSDLWAVMPAGLLGDYREALIWSGTFEAPCCQGAAHWIYDAFTQKRGAAAVHFIEPGYYSSTQDMTHTTSVPKDNLFLAILRECGGVIDHDCPASPPPPGPAAQRSQWPEWLPWPDQSKVRKNNTSWEWNPNDPGLAYPVG